MMRNVLVLVGGILLGAAGMWLAQRPPAPEVDAAAVARGKALYQVCAVCHGPAGAGNPDTQAPRLAGQHGWYLERQLRNFRAGLRGADPGDTNGNVMRPMAQGLPSDAAVGDVVAYIKTLRP